MTKIKLLPCPFCGEKEDISLKCKKHHGSPIEIDGMKYWFIECLPCDVRTGHFYDGDAKFHGCSDGKEMAISSWNRRK